MIKNINKRIAAAVLAFSIAASGAVLNLPIMNSGSITASAAGSVDPVTYARDYGYTTNTSGMYIYTSGTWKYASRNRNDSEIYLVESTDTSSSLSIPYSIDNKIVKGVSKNLKIAGKVTNVNINMVFIDNNSYINVLRGVLPKLPGITTINNEDIKDVINSVETNDSYKYKCIRKVFSTLNYEDNIAIANAMEKYIRELAKEKTDKRSNDYEKVKALHDWIINNHTYKETLYSRGDWCVFMNPNKQAVCDGFARAYVQLLQYSGFVAYYEGFGDHAAVIVKVYGDYYHVDISHDVEHKSHQCFLKADSNWCHQNGPSSSYKPNVDEREFYTENTRHIIRRPSKLYTSYLYQNSRWNNFSSYNTIKFNTVFGDLDGDKNFDNNDLTALRRHLAGDYDYSIFDSNGRKFLDFNHDGQRNLIDALDMQSFLKSVVDFNKRH
ncbi:hypothetical protein RASY3_00910 [Ruminococcus albus SY3]|uniref:Dockerin domain-containing protein n=1 Tax=Ruminococcus albus SY3 TaxID=1341156 RepID=A0A011W011_RUMAL|nr:transglutaminase domain-containing protein [Ruminococcus albus]EXM40916.1 hypothetical protein RASY3_00910 [Ruminococcus albus SY3]